MSVNSHFQSISVTYVSRWFPGNLLCLSISGPLLQVTAESEHLCEPRPRFAAAAVCRRALHRRWLFPVRKHEVFNVRRVAWIIAHKILQIQSVILLRIVVIYKVRCIWKVCIKTEFQFRIEMWKRFSDIFYKNLY